MKMDIGKIIRYQEAVREALVWSVQGLKNPKLLYKHA